MKMFFRLVLALMSVAFLFEESRAQSQAQENLPVSVKDLPVSVKELKNAPAEIVVDGKSLSLSTSPWRDYSPGPPGYGRPLMLGLKVVTTDKKDFPGGVRVDRVWLVFGEQIWDVTPRISDLSATKQRWIKCSVSPECEVPTQMGPTEGPIFFVDVVVRLIDKEGKPHLIQAKKQRITGVS